MKNRRSISFSFIIIFNCISLLNVIAQTGKEFQDEKICLFNKKTAALLGQVYILSNPMNDPNELVRFIHKNWEYFLEDGMMVKSARTLGYWMLEQDKNSLDKDIIEHMKNKLTDCQIPTEYACRLLDKFLKSNLNFTDLGNELIWLSNVLPCLNRGDLITYLNSETEFRKNLRKIMPIYHVIHNSDPEIAELILNDKNCYQQQMAAQISLLAIMSNL